MKRLFLLLFLFAVSLTPQQPVLAAIDVYAFSSPEQEQRFRALLEELRCPKCQNQNLAGSDAAVAKDLKNRAYELLQQGKSDDEIRQYLIERYGDFISYRPPLRLGTVLLWFGPLFLLLAVAAVLVLRLRRQTSVVQPLSADEQQRLQTLLAPDSKQKKQA
jgi:cytochrome c-type biogenesis protein CcmH